MKKNKETESSDEGMDNMESIISLDKYIKAKESQVTSYSILDLILDAQKKKDLDKYCFDNYEETDEEKEIFKAWSKRLKRRDDK